MSWFSGTYTEAEGVGYDIIPQVGARYIPGFNAVSSGSSASYIGKANISAVGYAVGVPTTDGISPPAGGGEIYGVIPAGGSTDYLNQTVFSGTAGVTAKRQLFRVEPGQPGKRFEVPYDSDNAPAVGDRLVLGASGSVKKAPIISVASDSTLTVEAWAAGRMFANWVCVALDTTNKYCIMELV